MTSRAYLAHAIRGKHGNDATDEQMQENCHKAKAFAAEIRILFPMLDLYVPGDNDLFVQKAYRMGVLTERQILDVDFELIRDRDFLMVYAPDGYISSGMRAEISFAMENSIPLYYVSGLWLRDQAIERLRQFLCNLPCESEETYE